MKIRNPFVNFYYLYFVPVLIVSGNADAHTIGERNYQILDSLRQHSIGDLSWSPDGAFLAYSVRRSASEEKTKSADFYWRKSRDEIFLWERRSGESAKLKLLGDGLTGAWKMVWSDDGAYLAFLSDADDVVNLWVWDRSKREVRQVTKDGIGRMGCEWISLTDMVCGVSIADGYHKPNYSAGGRGFGGEIDVVRKAWALAEQGENTASAIDSLSFPLHPHAIFRVSVDAGATREFGSAYLEYNRARDFAFKASPDGAHLTLRSDSSSVYSHFIRSRIGHPADISIHQSDGAALELSIPLPSDVILRTVKWSPDGRYLGFFALNRKPLHKDVLYEGKWGPLVYPFVDSREYPGQFYIIDVYARTIRKLELDAVDLGREARPPEFQWRGSDNVMFHTVTRQERLTRVTPRWITLDLNGVVADDSDDLGGLSPSLVRAIDGGLFGILEGQLVRIDADGQLQHVQHRGGSVPAVRLWGSASKGQGFAAADVNLVGDIHSIDLTKNAVLGPFELGVDLPQFAALSSDIYAYTETKEGVDRLKLFTPSGVETLLTLNEHVAEVRRFKQRMFTYTSANGTEAKGLITFPYDYDPKRQYPTIIDSDLGYGVHGQTGTGRLYRIQEDSLEKRDAATFAAAGYVYVFLSMPTNELDDVGRADLLSFTSGILPGVDWLVREGVADPDRVYLYGVSSMAYGVLGLVTQTSRFAAAVSAFGFADPAGARDLRLSVGQRYSPAAFDSVAGDGIYLLNSDQPSFLQSEDFRRNNPMTYVDRVVTPLMIVAGDMDSFALSEEPFFAALVLRRVPARFVRYWGVGHGPRGVENTLDYYARVVRWFDYWGDIERNDQGQMRWDGSRIKPKAERSMEDLEVYRDYPLFSDQPIAN